jgi:hypothetical protein
MRQPSLPLRSRVADVVQQLTFIGVHGDDVVPGQTHLFFADKMAALRSPIKSQLTDYVS